VDSDPEEDPKQIQCDAGATPKKLKEDAKTRLQAAKACNEKKC